MKAIRLHETGGPEQLKLEEVPMPVPGPGQVRVKVEAIGLNYIDIYFRTGLYKTALPCTPGMEAAGIVDAMGPDVTGLKAGDRVAYAMSLGAYAEYALVNAWKLAPLPPAIDFRTGAAAMLQGMTAHYLAHATFPLRNGHTALIHAVAGGVGLLLAQIAHQMGARVVGTASTEEKAALALEAGADHVIRYDQVDFESELKAITGGSGVDVVYDSVGQATFQKGLNCLKRRGMMVLFGQSSGAVPPLDLSVLNAKGSIYVTRPSLAHYAADAAEINLRAGDILQWIGEGKLKLRIDRTLPLREAGEAQRALESRLTMGKVLLMP
jgi:NADPH2:quinone reductase